MSSRTARLGLSLLMLLMISGFSVPWMARPESLSQGALQAFEALQGADSSGADIAALTSEYNSLLQSPSDGAFVLVQTKAVEAQQKALAQSAQGRIFTIVSIPLTALLLTLGLEGTLYLRSRLARRRRLDLEVANN